MHRIQPQSEIPIKNSETFLVLFPGLLNALFPPVLLRITSHPPLSVVMSQYELRLAILYRMVLAVVIVTTVAVNGQVLVVDN